MHGEQDEELEGTELAAEFQFSSLQKFGQEFLKKLRGKKMANALLKKVNCNIKLKLPLLLLSITQFVTLNICSYKSIFKGNLC